MATDRARDRASFFDFQARNRRATWRLAAVCALVVGGGGFLSAFGFIVNVGLVLFFLVFVPSVLLLGLGLVAWAVPGMTPLRVLLWSAAGFVMGGLDLVNRLWFGHPPAVVAGLAVALAAGGWLAVRSVWLAAGVGETLLAMGAREPAREDLEERQLANVVAEMAIAAGIPAPEVRLLDASVANAAAVGFEGGQSYVVVGRRLLDEFDRDETQSILGHLIAFIGNGDLRGAAQIHAMLYVIELLIVIVFAPFAVLPRRMARRWLAFPLRSILWSRERRAAEARVLIRLLRDHRTMMPDPDRPSEGARRYFGRVGAVLVTICPPLIALNAFAHAATGFLLLFASLPVALLWRSRRYLADATAVQLTRNPTGLYRGLAHLAACGAVIPGGEAVSHLFVIGPEGVVGRGSPGRATKRRTLVEREGLLMAMHPSLARRLARLVRMGAIRR